MNFICLQMHPIDLPGKPLFSFVSNRLAKLIHRKAIQQEWLVTYFCLPENEIAFANGFSGKLISCTGVILFTKDN